jgi:hypothetical protein
MRFEALGDEATRDSIYFADRGTCWPAREHNKLHWFYGGDVRDAAGNGPAGERITSAGTVNYKRLGRSCPNCLVVMAHAGASMGRSLSPISGGGSQGRGATCVSGDLRASPARRMTNR